MREAWLITDNFFKKLILQRTLLRNLVLRDLKGRYIGSLMGFFWAVIHPLVLLITYTFVFSVVMGLTRWRTEGTESFALALFCGILPWLLFQDTVVRSANSVMDFSNLMKKTKFPVEIVPISIFLANLVAHGIGLLILLAAVAWSGHLSPWAFFLPIYWVLLLVFSLGLGWFAATLQVFLRDTVQVLQVFMTVWFWFTPIFYSADKLPPSVRFLAVVNPLSCVVEGYRNCLLEGKAPEWMPLIQAFLFSIVTFVLGGIVFRVGKREFSDVL